MLEKEEGKIKILITGGLGHIGSKLIREYSKRADIKTIRILDNFLCQRYCSLFNLPESCKFEFIEGDILNKEDVQKAVEGQDVIIHLAALTDAPATFEDPEKTRRINFDGVANVLSAAKKAGVKKFLFPSTTSVYGEASGLIDENYIHCNPSSPYAESKLYAERIVLEGNEKNGIQTNVLRLGTIFGHSVGMRFHTAVNKFTWLACLGKPLTVWENAYNQKRPYLGLGDAIRAFEFIEKNGKGGERYNVLTNNYTVKDVVETIKKFIPELKIETTKSPILNQKSYEVSDAKVRALGFLPQDNLSEEIQKTIKLLEVIKNDKLLENSDYCSFRRKYKNNWIIMERIYPTVSYFRMKYKMNFENVDSKVYQVVYCKGINLKIPPYNDNNKIENKLNGYSILTATEKGTNKDVTNKVNQILGPMQNYYKDLDIKMKPRWFNLGTIMVMDNNINEFEIGKNEYFTIKN